MKPETKKFCLIENGKSFSVIVTSITATRAELQAADELKAYLKKMTGVAVAISNRIDDTGLFNILIGGINLQYDLDLPEMEKESFIMKTKENRLHIFGADEDALLFAACTFLEKYCDVRWFWPGRLGEVVPEKDILEIPEIDLYEVPDFKWRNRGPGGPLWGNDDRISMQRKLGVSEAHIAEVQRWERRNKLGGMKIWGGHEQANIVPPGKYGRDHVDYFALIDGRRDRDFENFDGKHGAQLCTTNPDLIPVFSAYFDAFFETHPEYDALHVTPNDGGRFCQCERCRALDTGKRLSRNPEKPVITDRIYTFVNTLARELQKKHPGKSLACMAYSWYVDPPERTTIDDHVIPQYCLWSCYLHWNEEKKNEHYRIARGWTEKAKNVGIYEYFINGAWPDLPRIVYPKIADSIRYLYDIGIKLYQCQAGDGFAINGLNYYIASKLWWDVNVDVNALVREYYAMAFGQAGKWIEKYHHRLMEVWTRAVAAGEHPSCSSFATTKVHEIYTLDLLSDCRNDLDKARKETDDPTIQLRIDFLEKGFTYVELTIQAVILTKKIENRGITISAHTFTDEEELAELSTKHKAALKHDPEINELIENALVAWKARDQYVESLKEDFIISYFWIKYNDENRVFNSTERLRYLQKKLTEDKRCVS